MVTFPRNSSANINRWGATAVDDLHAAHLAVDQLFGRVDDALVEVLAAHIRDGAREVALSLHAIADGHGLLEYVLIRFHLDGHLTG